MTLAGTRPPTVDEWDKYELHHRARLATKPGLTGMWQVSGRSNITDLEGGSTYFVHDHVKARKKFTFLHVDYKYAGYSRGLDRDCYLDFDRIFTVSGEVKIMEQALMISR